MESENAIYLPCKVGQVSDGYHTFDELYDHSCLLAIVLGNELPMYSWKSRNHDNGKVIDEFMGWFIFGITLPTGAITYHIPNRYWDLCHGAELEKAPQWDGHTSLDVLSRLKDFVEIQNPDKSYYYHDPNAH